MKKGLILSFEFPPHPGGIGTYSYQIAANFHRMGIPIIALVTPNVESDQTNRRFDDRQPLPIFRFSRWRSKFTKTLGRLTETLVFCQRHNIGWIFACSYKAAFGAFLCKKLFGTPYFLMGHGSDFSRSSATKKLLLKEAAGVFANSTYTEALMRSIYPRPVKVITLGADIEQYDSAKVSPKDTAKLRMNYNIYGSPFLLSVGRLNPRKGHDITLKGLVSIKETYPNVQIAIIGASKASEKTYEAELHRFVKNKQMEPNVRFISNVSSDELRAFYNMADVFILSSREYQGDVEGFGIVLLEANLMCTPVVASDSGGIIDAVENGKSGFLYRSEDSYDLADKVLLLLKNKKLMQEMQHYSRQRAIMEFNWPLVSKKTFSTMTFILPELLK